MRSRGLLFALLASTLGAVAQEAMRGEPIDLPTVLKLAGAQGIDVEIAEAKLREARAAADSSTWALFTLVRRPETCSTCRLAPASESTVAAFRPPSSSKSTCVMTLLIICR